jgi:hypothetical protein
MTPVVPAAPAPIDTKYKTPLIISIISSATPPAPPPPEELLLFADPDAPPPATTNTRIELVEGVLDNPNKETEAVNGEPKP